MKQLESKVAIITGAAKGLGAAVATLFVEEGALVMICDVDRDAGEDLARRLGSRAAFSHLDVTQENQWEKLIASIEAEHGKLDILVNNAAIFEVGNIESQSFEVWRRVNAVIADGTFFGCKHAVRSMKKTGGGRIVNVSSVGSLQGEPYAVAYVAAKGAVESMTRAVAVHCAKMRYPIRCNSLHPGPIATPMIEAIGEKFDAARDAGMVFPEDFGTGQGYRALPEEVAPSVLFLASDASNWVSGARLVADYTMSVTSANVPPPHDE
ncbi:MAG: SDR family oxidoreductase [Betaproteobacteria bacterium]|jgi:3(or 17)beta-hydroxysteroid dehydrogenase